MLLVVAPRIERALEVFLLHPVLIRHPTGDGVVYDFGRVAVVGGLLRLELGEKFEVFLVVRQVFAVRHPLIELLPLPFDFVFVIHPIALLLPPILGQVNAPIVQRVAVPLVGESVPVPVAEGAVRLRDVALHLLGCRALLQHLAGRHHVRHVPQGLEAHVAVDDDVALPQRVHQHRLQVHEFGVFLDALTQLLEALPLDGAGVLRHSLQLSLVLVEQRHGYHNRLRHHLVFLLVHFLPPFLPFCGVFLVGVVYFPVPLPFVPSAGEFRLHFATS